MAAQVERQRNEQLKKEREFQRQMSELLTPSQALMTASTEETKPHDFFISHASEDKDEVARPLYEALTAMGCEVWYDEFSLQLGDSLMRKINKGIAASRYGVVILSKKFLDKEWPQLELAALNAIEVRGVKKILPIWHHLTYDELLARAPMLADRVAADTSRKTIEEIAKQLKGMLD
ncbi:toll/interleukin-1 receptor domain-containing protein [Myxococcus sp. AB036A]|uniref:toll/interleukin-1 receptor domain-containing protein n=1 Tax=Myxococcus sp. AB036A TaxID=2562793 RepID=UPI0011474E12|nr:toll/interleukin-1 receptor domain-containing protein [Myxococcus sp. AB036A]